MAREKGVTNTVNVTLTELLKLQNVPGLKVPVSRRWVADAKSFMGVELATDEPAKAATAASESEAPAEERASFTE